MTTPFTDWDNCYDDGWGDLIVSEAYAHPAKFRPGLIGRIYEHGFERGWWKRLDVIGDPFGGIGGGGIMAAFKGLRWVGVELEPKFVELAGLNFERHRAAWLSGGDPIPEIIQGDSRQFAELVSCSSIVTSPPYADCPIEGGGDNISKAVRAEVRKTGSFPKTGVSVGKNIEKGYSDSTPGQIGNLKAIVTSPPYADSVKGDHGETETAKESRDKRETPGGSLGQSQRHGGYGSSEGNIGNLRAIDSVVTSPPWENQEPSHAQGSKFEERHRELHPTKLAKDRPSVFQHEYGESDGQLGNTSGETYHDAMKQVWEQCLQAIHPGGMLVVVVKDYVKGGKRVPLCDQTLALLESLGFVLVERIRAWVTKTTVHDGLFGEVKEVKEKKSFFRRLAEKKGSPPIDWEEVLCVTRP